MALAIVNGVGARVQWMRMGASAHTVLEQEKNRIDILKKNQKN